MKLPIPAGPSGKPIKPLGVVWYSDAQAYAKAQEMCPDMARAPYEEWLAEAEAALSAVPEGSQPRIRVPLVPALFGAWCAANRTPPNASARQRYVHDAVEAGFTLALRAHKVAKKAKKA